MTGFIWILLTLVVAAIYSLTMFIDNYLADVIFHGKKPEAVKPLGSLTYFVMIVVVFLVGDVTFHGMSGGLIAGLIFFGIIDALASIPYYKALKYEEATGLGILGQLTPVVALIVGVTILGEKMSTVHVAAVFLVLSAAILVILSNGFSKIKLGWKAARLMLLSIIIWVACDTAFIFFIKGRQEIFMEGFFLLLVGKMIGDTLLFSFKSWRKRLKEVWVESRWKFFSIFATNEIIYSCGQWLWRYVLIIAPTFAIASVTQNVSLLIFTFIFGICLSMIWPNFGRENINRRTILIHLLAVIMAVGGILLFHAADLPAV